MCGSEIDIVQWDSSDPIVQETPESKYWSYHTTEIDQIVSYKGFGVGKERERKWGSLMYLCSGMKSKRNILAT